MKTAPELTISMPARNTAPYIGQAIGSVLRQTGVDFELIVVDDASQDETAAVVEAFQDPRVRLLRNRRRRGIGYCHNRVLDESRSTFVAHVDSDDFLLPGALSKVVQKLQSDPRLGQTHCFYIEVNQAGETTREKFRDQRRALLGLRRGEFDYRRQMLTLGMVANHLRTYRREVFEKVGRFGESLEFGEDYAMALRILDAYEIAAVPEFLYCRRTHGGNASASLRFAALRFWLQRCRTTRRLKKSGAVQFLRSGQYDLRWAMLVGLSHVLGIPAARYGVRRWLKARGRSKGIVERAVRPIATNVYYRAVEHLSWWPLDFMRQSRRRQGGKRVGYYLWRFPVVTETFIRREMRALESQGFEICVFADGPAHLELADDDARALVQKTDYLAPAEPFRMAAYRRYFFRKNPVAYLNVMLYVLFHRYDYWKTLSEDRAVFRKAIYLAGMLRDRGVNHLHSPWADRSAFVAILAAKLLGIRCSVQARAHELHRTARSFALREKFTEANFVITNSKYNESFIRSTVDHGKEIRLQTIYEGVDLERFDSARRDWECSGPLRILSVAQLIEEKGIEYLLRACDQMKRSGEELRCEIIGGSDESRHFAYRVRLMKLHHQLGLEDWVQFLGAQPFSAVLNAFWHADIFVLPCVVASEGGRDITPNALIEAMAMQLPVVSTSLGAIPEIVENGVSGLLVPPNDPAALAEAITTLAWDAALRERLGTNARRKVEERFNINHNMVRFAEVFRSPSA
jgi:colanic acid/amylovoran biosynthesis glycosyltransferase